VQASAVVINHDPAKPDIDLQILIIDDAIQEVGSSDPVCAYLEDTWSTMRANWTADRPPDPPPEPWHLFAQRAADEMVLWIIASNPAEIDIDRFVAFCFRDETPVHEPPPSPESPQHLYALGMERERNAVPRWLTLFSGQLVEALGLQETFWAERGVLGPWWCGLNLNRRDLFDATDDGDVDFLAGPLALSVTPAEWTDRFEREALAWPLSAPRPTIVDAALRRACAEGLVIWPPRMDLVVACEAKASWYDAEAGKWKTTHAGEARRVRGQIQFLRDRGVDRVGFLHVGATKPHETGINPWFQASADRAQAEDAFELLDPLFGPAELPGCGYYRAVLGAVPHKTEDMAGAGGLLRVLHDAQRNPASPGAPHIWRAKVQNKLAACPRPTWPHVYITSCPRCEKWNPSGLPLLPCACAPPDAA
jgi:hypothetical protein